MQLLMQVWKMEAGGNLVDGVHGRGNWIGLAAQHHHHPHCSLRPGLHAPALTTDRLCPRYVPLGHWPVRTSLAQGPGTCS